MERVPTISHASPPPPCHSPSCTGTTSPMTAGWAKSTTSRTRLFSNSPTVPGVPTTAPGSLPTAHWERGALLHQFGGTRWHCLLRSSPSFSCRCSMNTEDGAKLYDVCPHVSDSVRVLRAPWANPQPLSGFPLAHPSECPRTTLCWTVHPARTQGPPMPAAELPDMVPHVGGTVLCTCWVIGSAHGPPCPIPCRASSSTTLTAFTQARCSSALRRSSPASSGCQALSRCSAPRASSAWWWRR